MAVFETVRPAPFGAISIHGAVVAIDNAIKALKDWNQRRRTVASLQTLSPAQLADIGLDGVDLSEFATSLGRR